MTVLLLSSPVTISVSLLCVFAGAGLLFTVPPPATVFISASCWLSQGPPSLPQPSAMWRPQQINAKKRRMATSNVPNSYMVRK